MRYYKRKKFLQLNPGIIYFDDKLGLCVKLETLVDKNGHPCDFFYRPITSIEFESSEDLLEKEEDSIKNGTSYPMNSSEARDGFFDDSRVFLVFEYLDLKRLEADICYAESI